VHPAQQASRPGRPAPGRLGAQLGFSGHFSTKSRAYSTTLGALRADRAAHQRELAIAAGLLPDLGGETTVVRADWHFTGRAQPLPTLPPLTGGAPCLGSC